MGVVFHTSWEKVFRSVEMAVEWGRAFADEQVEQLLEEGVALPETD